MANDPGRLDTRSRSFHEYFRGAREVGQGHYYVDRAIVGLSGAVPAFNVAKPRIRNGAFDGLILASVDLANLTSSWAKLTAIAQGQHIALYRKDGATIAQSWRPLVPSPDPAVEARVAE